MKLKLFWPIKKSIVSQGFGECHISVCDQYKEWGLAGHNGLDIVAYHGEPVYASHDGIITYAGVDSSEGWGIVIRTLDPIEYRNNKSYFKTIYWHLLSNIPVRVGQQVRIGDIIGYADNTGFSKGDHLHFGLKPIAKGENEWTWDNIHQNNGYRGAIDPMPYMSNMSAFQLRTTLQLLSSKLNLLTIWIDKLLHKKVK